MRALQTSQIILRAHYLKLVELLDSAVEKIDAGRKKVRFCAAKLLEYFRFWCDWVRQHEQRQWYYRKLKQIYDDLMGEHSLHVIRAAIVLLEETGLLGRSSNPNGQDKVHRYQVNDELLEQLLQRGQGLEYAQPLTGYAEEGETVEEDIKAGRILSPNALKENLQDSDRNLQNSTGESQIVNQNNQSSNNFSVEQSEKKTESAETASVSSTSSKANPDLPHSKPKIVVRDKSSAVEPWEIAPNQPYPYFLQWRALHYKNQGGHWADSPLTNAYSEFYKNPAKTNILWQEFLQFYNLALDNALALEAAGIEVRLPSCLSAVTSVSPEEVAQKAKTLTNHPQRPRAEIAPVPDFSARLSALVRQRTLPPTPKKQQLTDSLQMYLEWLHGQEPVLVEEARKKLNHLMMERSDLLAVWDEQGRLIDVETTAG
ncbi:hypothetical protein B7486_51880 [cyanobacterium TDX16]|nr:hypothetical protein B7486_51880 [cyanobacterium TDX16]